MIFYLMFPFIFKIVNTLKRSIIFLALTFVLAGLHYYAIGYLSARVDMSKYEILFSLFHQLPTFAMGMITFFIYNYLKTNTATKRLGVVVLIGGIVGLLGFCYFLHLYLGDPRPLYSIYVMTAFYGVIFTGLVISPAKILTNRVFVFFGTISYSLYLNHPMLVKNLNPVYQNIYSLRLPNSIRLATCFIVTLIPLTILSYLTYKLIEQPGMALGKTVIKKLTVKRVVKKPRVLKPEEQF